MGVIWPVKLNNLWNKLKSKLKSPNSAEISKKSLLAESLRPASILLPIEMETCLSSHYPFNQLNVTAYVYTNIV